MVILCQLKNKSEITIHNAAAHYMYKKKEFFVMYKEFYLLKYLDWMAKMDSVSIIENSSNKSMLRLRDSDDVRNSSNIFWAFFIDGIFGISVLSSGLNVFLWCIADNLLVSMP